MPEHGRVFLSLGSNLGDRREYLDRAVAAIAKLPRTELVRCSAVRETHAWGVEQQPDFLNELIEIRTALSPRELLSAVKQLETDLGRVQSDRWGPRAIDIDIIAYGRLAVNEPDLVIPHRECIRREFVLEPLREIAPEVAEELVSGTWVKYASEEP